MLNAFGQMPWGGILAVGAIAFIIRILDGGIQLPQLPKLRHRAEAEDEDEWVLVRRRHR